MVKSQRALDGSMETKAVRFLKYVIPWDEESAEGFLSDLASFSDDFSTDFVQSVGVLISLPSKTITGATVEMLDCLIMWSSFKVCYPLFQADLMHQLIITLNPQSLSFTEAVEIHTSLFNIFRKSIYLATPRRLTQLEIEDGYEQQSVLETVLKQVLVTSETYTNHLCVNRFSISNSNLSFEFMRLLVCLLRVCLYHQPTMNFILHMPVFLTIPSCLSFLEKDDSIWNFLHEMIYSQRVWNDQDGEVRQMWKTVHRMLRMEGIEDVMEEKLQNDENEYLGRWIVDESIQWNNLLGMNLPKQE
ncbi:hypothetical protein BLNAU_15229 [Blattamonas nauphoetae]|uniref:Uncharacterized protein n=1 Tax=Blattamonas nauphoetae TaxID=2049346 RepID=A0ABQ9XDR1_9EUKA|nr:hypothetical protein BLNAU_15229 [Blattamonas nauphoetae]